MKAVVVDAPGNAEQLSLAELAVPNPGPGHVLIKVAYAGINRPDILQRQGGYPPPKHHEPRLGLEVSGEVVAIASDVAEHWLGQQVCALCNGGAYAEYVCVPAGQILPRPAHMTMAEAAALPEALYTSWLNLIQMVGLKANERILIHGGAGGLGHIAAQLARWRGARLALSAGDEQKIAFCFELGAEWVMNYREQGPEQFCKTHLPGARFDVVLDHCGGNYLQQHINCADDKARIVQIAFQHGAFVELNLMRLMLKRICLTGSTLRIRSNAEKAQITEQLKTQLWPDINQINVHIDSVYELEQVAQAHRRIESGQHCGKIVLRVNRA
ncbi:NAD(P)H-quinone oxidoreductase [Agaribacterium haliotis]|uniref:NAD(P)H-quinone oxidoreductase n=1 Tax=Agaribacterium haliotis TaxID=2013869 RepID=UPI000BB53BD3|nr:NAD(P)H-quinone oxidoreductase [Agaribacterium haliotis]